MLFLAENYSVQKLCFLGLNEYTFRWYLQINTDLKISIDKACLKKSTDAIKDKIDS